MVQSILNYVATLQKVEQLKYMGKL